MKFLSSRYVIIRVLVVALLWQQLLPKVLVRGGEATTTTTTTTDSSSSFLFDNDINDERQQSFTSSTSSPPPLNDNICNAQLIAEFPSATAYSNVMATGEVNEISPGTGSDSTYFGCMSQDGWCSDEDTNNGNNPIIQSSVWFKFVSFDSGYMDISIDQPLDDMQLALWKFIGNSDDDDDEDCSSSHDDYYWSLFELIAANDDSSEGVYPLITNAIIELGEIYFIQLDGYAGETSTGYLLIDFDVVLGNNESNIVFPPQPTLPIIETDLLPPANDDICNAQYIDTIPSIIEYDNTMATSETNEIHPGDSSSGSCYAQDGWCFGDEIQSSIWFKFWSIEDGNIDIILVQDGDVNIGGSTTGDMQLALWKFGNIGGGGDDGENYICNNDWSLFQLIAANEDYYAGNFMPTISNVPIVANNMYYIQIDGYLGDVSTGNMTIEFYPSNIDDDDDDESPPITDDDTPPSSPGINPFIHDNICNAFDVSIPSVTNYGCHIDEDDDNNGFATDTTASWWLCSNNDYHYNIDDDDESTQMLIWFTFVATNSGNIDIIVDDDTTAGNFFKLTLWKYTGTAYIEDSYDDNGIRLEACLESTTTTTTTDLDWSTDMDVVAVNSRNGAYGFHPYIRNVNIEPNQLYYMKLDGGLYHHGGSNLSTGGQLEIKYSSSSSSSSTDTSTDNDEPMASSSSTDFDGGEASSDDKMTGGDDADGATEQPGTDDTPADSGSSSSIGGGSPVISLLVAVTSSAVLSVMMMVM